MASFFANLSGDRDLIVGFKTQRTLAFVGVVKSNRHSSLGDSTLSIFINQVLEVGGSYLSSESETKGLMTTLSCELAAFNVVESKITLLN